MLLGVFLLGMLVRRANTMGAVVGIASGAVCVCMSMWAGVGELWYGAVACIPTFLAGVAASSLLPSPASSKTKGLVLGHVE
jgi:Na+/proline symporter